MILLLGSNTFEWTKNMALGFLASDEQTHHHEVLIFTPADLSNLHALDNSYKTVGSLTMNDLSNAYRGNIDEHRENLYNMKLGHNALQCEYNLC